MSQAANTIDAPATTKLDRSFSSEKGRSFLYSFSPNAQVRPRTLFTVKQKT
jgi:hypothetical protein